MFNDKAVLITGGTGSFGKKYTETILSRYHPARIVIYSRDELKQYEMSQTFNSKVMRYFIGDVRDEVRLRQAMQGIDYVIHAAALKHVPVAEYNPMECIKTNIDGAQNVISASISANVKKVIALSTDKAANPINLYGATKLASDKLFVAANNITGGKGPIFSVVRYGNVVGSRGSVTPFFKKLVKQGELPLPVTHEAMTRFWITLQEGVDFVLKNFDRMYGGEIFVPKIPSVRILDLVEAYSGTREARFIGIRPGEKLHEIMCPSDDSHLTLEFADHFVLRPSIQFHHSSNDYFVNGLGENGVPVQAGFEYHSGNNPHFLSVEEIRAMDERA
jgi:UDP-N-acetylglucosamine 4,6-dehydratase